MAGTKGLLENDVNKGRDDMRYEWAQNRGDTKLPNVHNTTEYPGALASHLANPLLLSHATSPYLGYPKMLLFISAGVVWATDTLRPVVSHLLLGFRNTQDWLVHRHRLHKRVQRYAMVEACSPHSTPCAQNVPCDGRCASRRGSHRRPLDDADESPTTRLSSRWALET